MFKWLEKNWKAEEREDVYKPNLYSMILIDGDNNIVGQSKQKCSADFFHTLFISEKTLKRGKYHLIVDVDWQSKEEEFNEVHVKVITTE